MSELLKKYDEIIRYIIIGVLTTLVSLATYYICVITVLDPNISWQLQIANVVAWICAVVFSFFTNRSFVFKSNNNILKEGISFAGSRVLTLLLDMFIMFLFVTVFHFNDKIIKFIVQIVVTVVNYIFSKLFVFKKA